jgi:bifunctional DNase/RNase
MIDALQGRVERIVITDLRDNTFFATIHVDRSGQKLLIDARPSDAMALALRVKAPILVEEAVLERSSATGPEDQIDEAERLRRWLETVDPKELGNYEM